MKNIGRALSFVIVAIIYVIAAIFGISFYLVLPFDFWLNLLIADIIATFVTFLFSVIFDNASVYDPYWSVAPIIIVVFCAVRAKSLNAAQILPLIAIILWGVRLTANWAYTFKGISYQDWRYTMLKEKTGKLYPIVNFMGIHLFPTLVVYACMLPAVFTFVYSPEFNAGSVIFFALSILAALWQGASDYVMHKFRKSGEKGFNRNKMWKYSRHPNYLGEILMWWGVALAFVCVMPSHWYLISGAIINTLMFLFVSIPLADGRQARKEGFEAYKADTHMLLPIKKRYKN